MKISINNREISSNVSPYIIAELSANHNGSIELAKKNIDAAKRCGVDAIKLQTYTASTMTIDSNNDEFIIKHGPWRGRRLYELYEEAGTPYEWHKELFYYAKKLGLTIFSTPFDESAIDLLEELGTPAYKIASFELTDLPLIKYAAATKKPLLISTGLATLDEVEEAVEVAYSAGCSELLLFHCISSYPAPIDQANLAQIRKLSEKFRVPIGLSDHTIGNISAIAAVAIGAVAIEKHFTLSRSNGGPDSTFSIEPSEMANLVVEAGDAWKSIGMEMTNRADAESGNSIFRRSIYFMRGMRAGEVISRSDIRCIRPNVGIAPKYFDDVVGCKLKVNVSYGEPVLWEKLISNL
ncbi:pseudaminic acid synthase [Candidatus Methylopumilus universalis]|uniref:pseudaminic acid synthase n=1 Tax=Candidatus Methylopumilus universalis TaxID=2588536 RepID=UPI001120E6BE|nr:pseudaminic acid synthase [Candidatus Methylopumilus universalis]QDC47515.1 pseudaminic acid synthase [Candidatus Methylopumilus universalis]QDC72048.1 pseudaminic acid synthase [Candidatus Methylopumilus universalis]